MNNNNTAGEEKTCPICNGEGCYYENKVSIRCRCDYNPTPSPEPARLTAEDIIYNNIDWDSSSHSRMYYSGIIAAMQEYAAQETAEKDKRITVLEIERQERLDLLMKCKVEIEYMSRKKVTPASFNIIQAIIKTFSESKKSKIDDNSKTHETERDPSGDARRGE